MFQRTQTAKITRYTYHAGHAIYHIDIFTDIEGSVGLGDAFPELYVRRIGTDDITDPIPLWHPQEPNPCWKPPVDNVEAMETIFQEAEEYTEWMEAGDAYCEDPMGSEPSLVINPEQRPPLDK